MIEIPIKRREPVMRWIPCSERLPDANKQQVLITDTFGNIEVVWWYKGRFYDFDAVAWMPLPEAYEEEWK